MNSKFYNHLKIILFFSAMAVSVVFPKNSNAQAIPNVYTIALPSVGMPNFNPTPFSLEINPASNFINSTDHSGVVYGITLTDAQLVAGTGINVEGFLSAEECPTSANCSILHNNFSMVGNKINFNTSLKITTNGAAIGNYAPKIKITFTKVMDKDVSELDVSRLFPVSLEIIGCSGSVVANAKAYPNDDVLDLPAQAAFWHYSASNTSGKCEFECDAGYSYDAGTSQCVSISPPAGCSCNLPWGGTINCGESVTAYENPTEPCGSLCKSQTRNCVGNGNLSGSYLNQNCVALPCPSGCSNEENYCKGTVWTAPNGDICSGTKDCNWKELAP